MKPAIYAAVLALLLASTGPTTANTPLDAEPTPDLVEVYDGLYLVPRGELRVLEDHIRIEATTIEVQGSIQAPLATHDGATIELVASERITVSGAILGADGRSYGSFDAAIAPDGGDGSSIILRAPDIVIEPGAYIQPGHGGQGGAALPTMDLAGATVQGGHGGNAGWIILDGQVASLPAMDGAQSAYLGNAMGGDGGQAVATGTGASVAIGGNGGHYGTILTTDVSLIEHIPGREHMSMTDADLKGLSDGFIDSDIKISPPGDLLVCSTFLCPQDLVGEVIKDPCGTSSLLQDCQPPICTSTECQPVDPECEPVQDCLVTTCTDTECLPVECTGTECLPGECTDVKCILADCTSMECLPTDCSGQECMPIDCSDWECLPGDCFNSECVPATPVEVCDLIDAEGTNPLQCASNAVAALIEGEGPCTGADGADADNSGEDYDGAEADNGESGGSNPYVGENGQSGDNASGRGSDGGLATGGDGEDGCWGGNGGDGGDAVANGGNGQKGGRGGDGGSGAIGGNGGVGGSAGPAGDGGDAEGGRPGCGGMFGRNGAPGTATALGGSASGGAGGRGGKGTLADGAPGAPGAASEGVAGKMTTQSTCAS